MRQKILLVAALAVFLAGTSDHFAKVEEKPAVAAEPALALPATNEAETEELAPIPARKNSEPNNAEIPQALLKTEAERKLITDIRHDYRLEIPALGVDAGVLGMGNTADGKMAVPDNFVEASWYNLGPRPGEIGNSVLGAHVDNGGSVPGIFKRLKDLAIGEEITMTDRNGAVLYFKVSDRKIYDANVKDTSGVFGSVGKSRLVLITCYGTFIPSLNTYDRRIVVFADLIQ